MHVASLHIEYPMLFKVENRRNSRSTHCGVLEFIADEGMVYMPYWVRNCLFHLVSPFPTLFVLCVLSLLVTAWTSSEVLTRGEGKAKLVSETDAKRDLR